MKLKYDELLLSFAFNFNLRRYMTDGLRLGPVQEVTDMCKALATLVAARSDSDDDANDDGALSPAATAVVASGAVSGLVDVLGGAGWERWEAAAAQAAGATLQCVLRRTEDGPGAVIAAGAIAKVGRCRFTL